MRITRLHGPPIGVPLYTKPVAIALTQACYLQRHFSAHAPGSTPDILDNNNLPSLYFKTGSSPRLPDCPTSTYMITPRAYSQHNPAKHELCPNIFCLGGCPHPTAQTCRSGKGLPSQKPKMLCALHPLKVDIALVMVCRSPLVDQQHKQFSSNTKTQPFLTATNNVIPTTTQPYITITHKFHKSTPHQYTHAHNYSALTQTSSHYKAYGRKLGRSPRQPTHTPHATHMTHFKYNIPPR
jgi:hypothetical protein